MLRLIPLEHTELRKSLKAAWHNNRSLVCEYFLCLQALNTGWLEWEKEVAVKWLFLCLVHKVPTDISALCFLNGSALISPELPTHVTVGLLWCGVFLCYRAGSFIRLLPCNSLCQGMHSYLQCGCLVKAMKLWTRELPYVKSNRHRISVLKDLVYISLNWLCPLLTPERKCIRIIVQWRFDSMWT